MGAGDKEQRLIFEDITRRNVLATVAHSNETRKVVRSLEEQVSRLQNIVISTGEDIKQLKIQLASLQTRVFGGGT